MKNIVRGKLKQFDVALKDEPGMLANLTELLGVSGINIRAIATETRGNGAGVAKIITEDENTTRAILERGKFPYIENEVLHVNLLDRPGELAKIARILAKSKINIHSIFILEKSEGESNIALKVSDLSGAKRILG